jgi:perosamine synthetase
MQVVEKPFVPFWRTVLGDEEIQRVGESMRSFNVSQGKVTEDFEARLATLLSIPYVVLTTNGSTALYMAMSVAGLGAGDEIIIPNRTFIATAHAALLAGATVVLVDTQRDAPVVDHTQIEAAITSRTRAICAVHLNGRACDMRAIREIADRRNLTVIEDAAQGLFSSNEDGYLGTQSSFGCFSLGITKFITTGQGGFVTAHNAEQHEKLFQFRNHGVRSTYVARYDHFGFNFKYTDVQASIGLAQLERISAKRDRHLEVYRFYERELAGLSYLRLLPVDIDRGELPLWVEALAADRDELIARLEDENVQARPFLPDLSEAKHLHHDDARFVNSKRFARHGLFLPCGPDLSDAALSRTIAVLRKLAPRFRALA